MLQKTLNGQTYVQFNSLQLSLDDTTKKVYSNKVERPDPTLLGSQNNKAQNGSGYLDNLEQEHWRLP